MTTVTISPAAIVALKDLMAKDPQAEGRALRVGVKGGGCSGLSYILDFDDRKPLDEVYDFDGVPVVVDPRHSMYLLGTEVDYKQGLNDRGFIFHNPNAKSTCGCGESFAA